MAKREGRTKSLPSLYAFATAQGAGSHWAREPPQNRGIPNVESRSSCSWNQTE